MKALCVGYEGAEDILQKEVKELVKVESKAEPSVAIFDVKKREDLFKLGYLGQSFLHVLELLGAFNIEEFDDLKKITKGKINFKFLNNKAFRVSCKRIGDHNFGSQDICARVGELILDYCEKSKIKANVDLHDPDYTVFLYIYNNQCYVGLDFIGLEIGKRDYNVYPNAKSTKAPLAFALLVIAGYKPGQVLVDPQCLSGMIPIESAFYSNKGLLNYFRKDKFAFVAKELVDEKFLDRLVKSGDDKKEGSRGIFGYDFELRNVKAARHNAKIGGVDKLIEFSKVPLDALDIKFGEGKVDLIVTIPLIPTQSNKKECEKSYTELFHQAEFVLKKGGKLVVVSNKLLKEVAEKYKLELKQERKIIKGKQTLIVDVYSK